MKITDKPKPVDLKKMLAPYAGLWVALNNAEDKVLASGNALDEVLKKASDQGETNLVVIKSPDKNSSYLL